jgi:hypothetical protein
MVGIEKNALGFVTREPKKDSEGRIIGGYNFYHYHMGCHENEVLDSVFTKTWLEDRKKRLEAEGRDPRLFCFRCGEEIKIE